MATCDNCQRTAIRAQRSQKERHESRCQTRTPASDRTATSSRGRAIERPDVVDFADREAEHVDAQRRADAADPVAIAAGEAGLVLARPRQAGVGEQRHLDRERAVDRLRLNRPSSGNRSSALPIATRLPFSRSNASHAESCRSTRIRWRRTIRSRSRAPGPGSRGTAATAACLRRRAP